MFDRLAPIVLPFVPARAATRIGHAPHWAMPLVVVVLAQIVIGLIGHPVRVEQTLAHIPRSATQAELTTVRDELERALPWDLAVLPLKEAAGAATGAVVLGLVVGALGIGQRPRFAMLFALYIGLSGIGIVEKGAEIAFLSATGHLSALPPYPWSGLVFTGSRAVSYPVGLLLTTINLFTLWYVGALARALAVLCNISKAHAVLIAVVFWAVTAGCAIAVLHLLRNAYVFTF